MKPNHLHPVKIELQRKRSVIMPQMQLLRLVKRCCLVFFEDSLFTVAK
jgi:hypothetical protein